MSDQMKMNLVIDLAEIENQLSCGGCERIQMGALVAAFYSGVRTK